MDVTVTVTDLSEARAVTVDKAVDASMLSAPNATATVHQTWEATVHQTWQVEYEVSPDSSEEEQNSQLETQCQVASKDCTLVSSDSRRQLQGSQITGSSMPLTSEHGSGDTSSGDVSPLPLALPPCQGDAASWTSAYGNCTAYQNAAHGQHGHAADCMVDIALPPKSDAAAIRDYHATPPLRAFEVCASCNKCVDKRVQTPAPTPEPAAPSFASATLVRTLKKEAQGALNLAAEIPDLKASGVTVVKTTFGRAEVVFTMTQLGGVAEAESLLIANASLVRDLIAKGMGFSAQSTFGVTVQRAVFPPRPPPMAPPTPPSPPPPAPPPPPPHPPPSTEIVVIRMTASGNVEDYTPEKVANLQENLATVAGVDKSLVAIVVEPGSVLITATIAVPASMQSYGVRNLIKAKLGTAEAASAVLGIIVLSAPSFVIASTTPLAPLNEEEAMQNEAQSEELPVGLIVGICVGVVVIGLVAFLGVHHYRKAQKAQQTAGRSVTLDATTKNLPVQPNDAPPAGKADAPVSGGAGASSDLEAAAVEKDTPHSTYV